MRRFGPSDKTGADLADSDRPRRRLPPLEGKEGIRPSGPSERTTARSSGSEKDNMNSSSQAGKGVTQSAPRQYAIWILENDKPKRVMVTTGISDGSFTEITSGDVAEGQAVITGSATNTKNNSSTSPSNRPPRFF